MIRPATHADVGALLLLAEQMHAESRFSRRSFDHGKVARLLSSLIDGVDGLVLVAEQGGAIAGGFAGYVTEDWFGPDRVAGDFALFVRPDRRGGLLGIRLLNEFRKWAQSRGAEQPECGVSTGVDLDATSRLYRLAGFEPVGTIFEFKGESHVHGR